MSLKRLLLYFNTVKYLSLRQVIYNFIRRFSGNQKIVCVNDVEYHQLKLVVPIAYKNKINNQSVCFLNEQRSLEYIGDWACLDEPKLWRYNLHYFDFLLDDGVSDEIKDKLINSWIFASANLKVDAWEPYPVSLRLVNWIKYFIVYKNNVIPKSWLKSLNQQANILFNSIEYHILANHYLKNGKALFFVGAYLNCSSADKWFVKGRRILLEQAGEQIFDDGGHYEKSPMYHSILVEDYLDALNLVISNSINVSEGDTLFLKAKTEKALDYLSAILMPDGDIPLFNDSAFEIAPHPDLIFSYANRLLGYEKKKSQSKEDIISLEDSGYYIINSDNSKCIVDCGSISPSYQPGHTHCDLLSYELAIAGERVVVNSGLHDYENSDERMYCRSTKAHNTVEIDGKEQSEIWGQFRVARRAEVISSDLSESSNGSFVFRGSYRPYWVPRNSNIGHTREIEQVDNEWKFTDVIAGSEVHSVKSYIHLHPEIICKYEDEELILFKDQVKLAKLTYSDNVIVSIDDGWYYPEFGKKITNTVITLTYKGGLPVKLNYKFTLN